MDSYHPASTIKMLLIAALMVQVDAGRLSLDETATVEADDIVGGFGVLQHESPEQDNYINAGDSIELLRQIYAGSFLREASREKILEWMGGQTVKTKIAAGVPAGTPIAHKTGENGPVSHDIGYLLIPGREVAIAIFAEVTRTSEFDAAQALANPTVARVADAVYTYLMSGHTQP